jgi:hypothetical protein
MRSVNIRATIRLHHPLVVPKINTYLSYPCACGQCVHSSPLHSRTTFVPHFAPLHFFPLSFYAHTSAPHSFGSFLSFHSASSINTVSHYPSHFPTHYQWYVFIFCDVFEPIKRLKTERKAITPNKWGN